MNTKRKYYPRLFIPKLIASSFSLTIFFIQTSSQDHKRMQSDNKKMKFRQFYAYILRQMNEKKIRRKITKWNE